MTNEYKIGIIGPTETVSGLKALGVVAFEAQTGTEVLEQLRKIKLDTMNPDSNTKFAVVCVIEELMTAVDQSEYSKIVAGPLPAVVVLPGTGGSKGFAINRLRKLAEQAVGSAII